MEFRLKFHWSLFLRVQLKYSIIGADNGLAPSRRQAIFWTNNGKLTDAYIRHSASTSFKQVAYQFIDQSEIWYMTDCLIWEFRYTKDRVNAKSSDIWWIFMAYRMGYGHRSSWASNGDIGITLNQLNDGFSSQCNNCCRLAGFDVAVLKIRTICDARGLWKLAWSCKQLRLLCQPDL